MRHRAPKREFLFHPLARLLAHRPPAAGVGEQGREDDAWKIFLLLTLERYRVAGTIPEQEGNYSRST